MNPSSSALVCKRKRDPDDAPKSCKRPKHDVFINYSSDEIGKSFISHLKRALDLKSFSISDHTMLTVGQDVHTEVLKAIEESEICVLVFSPDYASSTRCLDELVHIMDLFRKFDERKVVPVFFKVDPSHVKNQQGPFMEAFQAHQTNLDPERVQKWREALKKAGHLSGLELQNGSEAEFISVIVEQLEKMQRPPALWVTDHHTVGLKSRAKELISTLRLNQKDIVLVVAVLGISGIGKTTIVKEAYNRIAASFDLSCFLLDIHSICQAPNWKVKLPKKLISCLTRDNKFSFMGSHNDGVTKIRKLVSGRKVLLVLDDIDNSKQLESLGICPKWFCEGSRIIVTTREKRSLGNIPYASYHTRLLNRRESLDLFTRLMFVRYDLVNTNFVKQVVDCAGGLPLVLKVWSCHFKQYEREQWPTVLETLKAIPHGDVQKQLQVSYDSLPSRAKKLFLDIACFFNHWEDKDLVVKVLQDEDLRFFPNIEIQYLVDKSLVEIGEDNGLQDEDSKFFPDNEIQYLVDRSLVEIREDNQVWMHRAIVEMGQEIVRKENEEEPGQRTRLHNERDVERVLKEYSGTKSVESLIGWSYETDVMEAFSKMTNLRLINFLSVGSSDLSDDQLPCLSFKKLKYMKCFSFPYKSLEKIEMCNVVVLQLHYSRLETLWEGIKILKKLRILDLTNSHSLTRTGNLSGLENLEELKLYGCINLKELHGSIGDLKKLAILDLRKSMPLKSIPWEVIGKIASLQKLFLGLDYSMLINSDSYMLDRHKISDIPGGVVSLPFSKNLSLHKTDITNHPDSLLQLHGLKTLELEYCDSIHSIPNLPGNLTYIKAHNCRSLVNLPCNISELKSLTALDFFYCPNLGSEDPDILKKVTGLTNLTHLTMYYCNVSKVPSEIGNLVSLKELDLSGNTFSSLPDTLSNLSQLDHLSINDCKKLKLLPLLPSNLSEISAVYSHSIDLMSCASLRTKVCKESPFSNKLKINLSFEEEGEVPEWCSNQSRGDNGQVLSFVAPMHQDNSICGIFLCANASDTFLHDIVSKMHNKTKHTSHRLVCSGSRQFSMQVTSTSLPGNKYYMRVMCYPLDDTTLVVEPGDHVLLKFPQTWISSYGSRLIYESDVVDAKLTLTKPYPLPLVLAQSDTIFDDSDSDDYSFSSSSISFDDDEW